MDNTNLNLERAYKKGTIQNRTYFPAEKKTNFDNFSTSGFIQYPDDTKHNNSHRRSILPFTAFLQYCRIFRCKILFSVDNNYINLNNREKLTWYVFHGSRRNPTNRLVLARKFNKVAASLTWGLVCFQLGPVLTVRWQRWIKRPKLKDVGIDRLRSVTMTWSVSLKRSPASCEISPFHIWQTYINDLKNRQWTCIPSPTAP